MEFDHSLIRERKPSKWKTKEEISYEIYGIDYNNITNHHYKEIVDETYKSQSIEELGKVSGLGFGIFRVVFIVFMLLCIWVIDPLYKIIGSIFLGIVYFLDLFYVTKGIMKSKNAMALQLYGRKYNQIQSPWKREMINRSYQNHRSDVNAGMEGVTVVILSFIAIAIIMGIWTDNVFYKIIGTFSIILFFIINRVITSED